MFTPYLGTDSHSFSISTDDLISSAIKLFHYHLIPVTWKHCTLMTRLILLHSSYNKICFYIISEWMFGDCVTLNWVVLHWFAVKLLPSKNTPSLCRHLNSFQCHQNIKYMSSVRSDQNIKRFGLKNFDHHLCCHMVLWVSVVLQVMQRR